MNLDHINETAKHTVDALSIGVAIGTLAQWLPSIAALMTILWLAIRVWESDTVRGWTRRALTGRRDDD